MAGPGAGGERWEDDVCGGVDGGEVGGTDVEGEVHLLSELSEREPGPSHIEKVGGGGCSWKGRVARGDFGLEAVGQPGGARVLGA